MAKKIILILIILILAISFGFVFFYNGSVDIYLDGENVTVETHALPYIDATSINVEVCDYTLDVMNDTTTDIGAYKHGIRDICREYGLENPEINLDSSIGPDQMPMTVYVDGTSMLPTLQDGQTVLLNRTHDIHVGDIVVAESDEYGGIIKRVDEIDGSRVHLVSDNKNVSYEYIDGVMYEVKGITTWVDISNITGVVIDY